MCTHRHGTADSAILATLSLILHAADISNPGKPWVIHKKCADCILTEFFAQGDEERKRGLPISPLCDRTMTDMADTQITFIEVIVEPTLVVLGEMFDHLLLRDSADTTINSVKNRPKSRQPLKQLAKRNTTDNQRSDVNFSTMP